MRVVDTSLWVEYFADGSLTDHAEKCIVLLETCAVPAMLYYELVKWFHRKFDAERAKTVLSMMTDCRLITMDVEIAAEASLLSIHHKFQATDAITYATARLLKAKFFTSDVHFRGLPDVEYYEKTGKDTP
jgi:toxin FitB